MKGVTRVQFEIPSDQAEQLKGLMRETKVRTKKDLFNNALTLLKWAVKEKKLGHEIVSIDENEKAYKELAMPVLSNVAKNSKKKQRA